MQVRTSIAISLLILLPVLAGAQDLRSVVIAWRPDLATENQKEYLRDQLAKLRDKEAIKDSFRNWQVFEEVIGDVTNTWHVLIQPVHQLRASGLDITLAKLKEILHYDTMTDRLRIGIAPPYGGIAFIETVWLWKRPKEQP